MSRSPISTCLMALLALSGCVDTEGNADETQQPAAFASSEAILFVGTETTGRQDLYRIQATGEGLANLTQDLEILEEGWSFEVINQRLAYTPSPRGEVALVMLSDDEGILPNRLFEVDTETGTSTFLADLPPDVTQIRFTPDGAIILVETRAVSGLGSAIHRLDGDSFSRLGAEGESLTLDDFFSDGLRALVRLGLGSDRRLGALDLITGAFTPAGETGGMEVMEPSISPDGSGIIFQGWVEGQRCADIYWVPTPAIDEASGAHLDGNLPVALGLAQQAWLTVYGDGVDAPGDHQPGDDDDSPTYPDEPDLPPIGDLTGPCLPVSSPSFSPDGSGQISFLASSDLESLRQDLFITRGNGSVLSPTQNLGTEDSRGVTNEPPWSPQGGLSLFTFRDLDPDGDGERTLLYWGTAPEDGQAEYGVMTPGYGGNPKLPHWSADGTQVLFWAQGTSMDGVIVETAGGDPRAITGELSLEVLSPMWLMENTLFY